MPPHDPTHRRGHPSTENIAINGKKEGPISVQ
jgi:hypothetical protein